MLRYCITQSSRYRIMEPYTFLAALAKSRLLLEKKFVLKNINIRKKNNLNLFLYNLMRGSDVVPDPGCKNLTKFKKMGL